MTEEPSIIRNLGIIAGGGALPARLVSACRDLGIAPFIVALKNRTDPDVTQDCDHVWSRLGAAGSIIRLLKAREISDLVLIGSVSRPSFAELRPDWRTLQFFTKIGMRAMGDNDLLSLIRSELEQEGFRLHGVHRFMAELLAPPGCMTALQPDAQNVSDIARGLEISQALGVLDVGQSVVVQDGIVLGLEAVEGTEQLIARSGDLKRKGRSGGVLVKTCKPQQDRDLDLPTIGPDTVRQCADAGLSGIAVHADHSLILDVQEVIEAADRYGLFLVGTDPCQTLIEKSEF